MRNDNFDRAADILKVALEHMKVEGIPDEDVPPVLADFGIWLTLRMAGVNGGEAILRRMYSQVAQWSRGEHPMQELMCANGEQVAITSDGLDATALRVAMEHLLEDQELPLDQAAACFVIYAMDLTADRLGADRARALAQTALSRVPKDRTDGRAE